MDEREAVSDNAADSSWFITKTSAIFQQGIKIPDGANQDSSLEIRGVSLEIALCRRHRVSASHTRRADLF